MQLDREEVVTRIMLLLRRASNITTAYHLRVAFKIRKTERECVYVRARVYATRPRGHGH